MKSIHKNRNYSVIATSSNNNFGSIKARILGSSIAGVGELLIFHPIDTIAKRLMANEKSSNNWNKIIFRDSHNLPLKNKFLSLFPGLGYGALYKISQRVYKFGGQPFVKDYLEQYHGQYYKQTFGNSTGKILISAVSGSIMGMGEVVLLPFDALKIKSQLNPELFNDINIFNFIKQEKFRLYRGWGWTIARNAPGSFALFGGAAATKTLLGIVDRSATFLEDCFASVVGSVASITIAAPLDVIKTRLQSGNISTNKSGFNIIEKLIKQEGVSSLFKGLTPKLAVVGPKLIFSFTIAQQLIQYFSSYESIRND